MPPLPALSDIVILGLATWAVTAAAHYSTVADPVRRLGFWSLGISKWLSWLFTPAQAIAVCFFCTSWWAAATIAAAALPGWIQGGFLVPALVGAACLIEAARFALQGRMPLAAAPRKTAEELFAQLVQDQARSREADAAFAMQQEAFAANMRAQFKQEGAPLPPAPPA